MNKKQQTANKAKIIYLTGLTVNGRQELLMRELAGRGYPSFLYLLSSRGKVIEYEGDPRFWLKGWVDTLSGLVHLIFESCLRYERFNTSRHLDEGSKNLLIKKVLEDRAGQPDGLSYLSTLLSARNRERDYPGIYRSLSGFFSLLIRNNQQDRLADALGRLAEFDRGGPGPESGSYALENDLVWIFGDYEELKTQLGLYDDDDILRSVRDFLQEQEALSCLDGREIIILDNPVHLSKIEEDILEGLFLRVKEVWWLRDGHSFVPAGPSEISTATGQSGEHLAAGPDLPESDATYEAFRLVKPVYEFMKRLEKQGFEQEIKTAERESLPHPLAESLFLDNRPAADNGTIRFRSFADRVSEVKGIASEIKRINHEKHLDREDGLGRIRVIFPRLRDYASIISEIFTEYAIPFSLTKGLPLSAYPLSDLFLNLIKIPMNGFNLEDIFQLFTRNYMTGPLSRFRRGPNMAGRARAAKYSLFKDDPERLFESKEEGNEFHRKGLENIFLLERVGRRCGLKRLHSLPDSREEEEILHIRETYRQSIINERMSAEREILKREYYGFLFMLGSLQDLMKPLAELGRQSEPQGLVESFESLLRDFQFPDIILNPSTGPCSAESTRLLKRDVKAYNLLQGLVSASGRELALAKRLFGLEGPGELLAEFYSIFRSRLQSAYLYDERNPNIVRISEWLEIRERSFEYVFAGGLTADNFPLKEESNFLNSGSRYHNFRQIDPVEQSKYLFSHLLRNFGHRLYLSCPRFIDEKAIQPTPILFDVQSLMAPVPAEDDDLSGLEETLKWEENPYYSSESELYHFRGSEDAPETGPGCEFGGKIVVKNQAGKEGLVRGIDLLFSRLAEDGLFEYDGQIREAVRFRDFSSKKPDMFSPSQLEMLANCPMRYLFERVYRLRPMEEPGDELSPREIGTHIHAILSRLFDRLKMMGSNVHELGLAPAFALAREVAEDYFAEHVLSDRFEYLEYVKSELLLGLDREPEPYDQPPAEREGVLARLLRFEGRALPGQVPRELEYAFGDLEEAPVRLGRCRLIGCIDRFDIDRNEDECVYIYDYKTGRPAGLESVKKGLSFQLPAYMAALKQLHGFKKITAAFYSVKPGKLTEEAPFSQVLRERTESAGGLDVSGVQVIGEFADRLIDQVEQGLFHYSADALQCEYCDFRYACYRDNRRMNFLIDRDARQAIYSGKTNIERWKEIDNFKKRLKEIRRSMDKSFTLKTAPGRQKHAEAVLSFSRWLEENREKLPFSSEYLDDIVRELDDYKNRYQTPGTKLNSQPQAPSTK